MRVGDFEITKRELISSGVIIFLMLFIGFFISEGISNRTSEKNEIYYTATKIDNNKDQFKYGMETNIGNALIFGDVVAVDAVSIPELNGEYLKIRKIKQRYTQHTKTVTYTDSKGNSRTKLKAYYNWDTVDDNYLGCEKITFLDVEFESKLLNLNFWQDIPLNSETVTKDYKNWISGSYLYQDGDTWTSVGDVRYEYYVVPKEFNGSILATLKDGTLLPKSKFYKNMEIQDIVTDIENGANVPAIFFWATWCLLICGVIIGFVRIENRWLEE
ncbi:MAG: hypothetical protein RR313_11820 [Anaerovoracaceae bacterium]